MRKIFNENEIEISEALPEFYVPYASYVIQTRALPDARDGLKSGARFILYSQYTNKITFKDKRRKGTATKSAAMMFSPHGDAAIYGNAVRMSQPFSLRYPLIDTQGNNGSLMHNNDYAADRYLEMRSGKIVEEMTSLLKKETVDIWKLNYTEEEEYPTYLPTLFPNSLVNGNFGIGVSLASSIPSHNLIEVCTAIIKMIDNPEIDFEEIYCPIDFPTGGTIINADEVKESHRIGHGKSAIIRATIEYDSDKNELIVTDLPYMVFSSNATQSIQNAIDEGLIQGIDKVYDGTASKVEIVISLTKTANVQKIVRLLYKHTLLQSSFGINMNMLKDGKYPKLFSWEEMLKTFIKHLGITLERSYNFDLKKYRARVHILNGLIIAIENIENVVTIIKNSENNSVAKEKLINQYSLSEPQAKAILDLKLSRLANLELKKIVDEKKTLEDKIHEIEEILNNKELFNNKMKEEINRISKTYGDARRTKNINLDYKGEDEEAEPIEKKELLIYFTNLGNIYTQESTTLMKTRRGGKGTKIKLSNNEAIIQTINDDNFSSLLAFSNKGKMYSINIDDLPVNSKINVAQLFDFENGEIITALTSLEKKKEVQFFTFITKNGMIKKTKATEYVHKRGKSLKAINLKDDDEVVNVLFTNNEKVGILTYQGNFVIINTDEINSIGRATAGIKAIKLNSEDTVIKAQLISDDSEYMITVSNSGLVKKSSMGDYPVCSRATKGRKISGIRENDMIVDFLTLKEDCDIIINTKRKVIKINTQELRVLSRDAIGVKSIELSDNDSIKGLNY